MKLSENFRHCLRMFTYYYTNGTLGFMVGEVPTSGEIDYREELKDSPSNVEAIFSVYMNNIEMDDDGIVLNNKHAMKRAAQYIRSTYDSDYVVVPEFEDWELELY